MIWVESAYILFSPGWDGASPPSPICPAPAPPPSPSATAPLPSWRLPLTSIPLLHPPCAEVRRQEEEKEVAVKSLGGPRVVS